MHTFKVGISYVCVCIYIYTRHKPMINSKDKIRNVSVATDEGNIEVGLGR